MANKIWLIVLTVIFPLTLVAVADEEVVEPECVPFRLNSYAKTLADCKLKNSPKLYSFQAMCRSGEKKDMQEFFCDFFPTGPDRFDACRDNPLSPREDEREWRERHQCSTKEIASLKKILIKWRPKKDAPVLSNEKVTERRGAKPAVAPVASEPREPLDVKHTRPGN